MCSGRTALILIIFFSIFPPAPVLFFLFAVPSLLLFLEWERDEPLKKQSSRNPGFEQDPNVSLRELFVPLFWHTNAFKVAALASSPLDPLHDKFREK